MNLGGIKVALLYRFLTTKPNNLHHHHHNHMLLINLVQVGSIEIERVCNSVDDSVLETAAIGVPPSSGGPEQLVIAVVFKSSGLPKNDLNLLKKSFNSEIQKKLNPLFKVYTSNTQESFLSCCVVSIFDTVIEANVNVFFWQVSSVVTLPSLPRTATNKVMRRVLRQRLTQTGLSSKL